MAPHLADQAGLDAGCGGRKLSDVKHDQPDWLASAAREWGYGRVSVFNGQEMLFEFVESESGDVADFVRLSNTHSQQRDCRDDRLGGSSSNSSRPAAAPMPGQQLLGGMLIKNGDIANATLATS